MALSRHICKNKDYIEAGKSDIYDFYLCDRNGHCIRKITPDGIISTYAGRGSVSSDGRVNGYIDGELRTEARFDSPLGSLMMKKHKHSI